MVDFNLRVMPGEAVGVVGESGCGKSTVALAIMCYLGKNGRIVKGSLRFKGRDMTTMSEEELRQLRGSKIAMVYQEPMASLNPSLLIGKQLMEVPLCHEQVTEAEALRAGDRRSWARSSCPTRQRIMNSYPHQISGGQQQRVVIAMALLSNPALLILDEPTTALDVTVEAGIVALIKDIAGRFGTSMVYISHNLGLILETCDRITVMYSGEAVETGTVTEVFDQMRHPYTRGLFNSIPLPGADKNARPLVPIPRPAAAAAPAAAGLLVRAALRLFRARRSAATAGRRWRRSTATAAMRARCRRFREIDWEAAKPRRQAAEPQPLGPVVLEVDQLKKYYEISDSSLMAMLSGTKVALRSRPTSSSISMPARRRPWRSSANPAAASRPSPR